MKLSKKQIYFNRAITIAVLALILTVVLYITSDNKSNREIPVVHLIVVYEPQQANAIEIETQETHIPKPKIVSRGLPRDASGEFKSYMDYRTITNKSSLQWQLQQECWTDEDGLRRFEDYYVVALGTYYAESVGKKFIIHFESGVSINVIVGDIKDDRHTDESNRYITFNGNIVEFIVDTHKLNRMSLLMGDVSYIEGLDISGAVIKIDEIVKEEG